MKQEYKTGGWVKCIAEARTAKTEPYNQFKLGEYYQIKCIDSNNMITTSEGYKMYTISNFAYDTECEWVGMEKPAPKSIIAERKEEGVDTLILGEWYMIGERQLPITDCWLGEGGRFKNQGPYKILVKSGDCATKVNDGTKDIGCILAPSRFRKCRPEELPKTEIKVEHKEEKWEPKAGEYAVMTKSYRDIPIGRVVKIIKSQEVLDCWYVDFPGRDNENDYAPYLHCMRKALSHEIPQEKTKTMTYTPQIGDWIVPVTPYNTPGCSLEIGKVYQVKSLNRGVTVSYCGTGIDGGDIYFADLRKARPEEIPTKPAPVEDSLIGGYVIMNRDYREYRKGEYAQIKGKDRAGHNLYIIPTRDLGPDTKVYVGVGEETTYVGKSIPTQKQTTPATPVDTWAEKPDPMDEILAEAKRRFPIGTIIKGLAGSNGRSIEEKITKELYAYDNNGISHDCLAGYVYWKGAWAEIIQQPSSKPTHAPAFPEELMHEAKRRFPAGTKFVPHDMHGEVYTVSSEERYYEGITNTTILVKTKEGVGGQYLLYNGKWAKLADSVSTTKEEMLAKATRMFPKGTKYKGLRDDKIYTSEGYVNCTMSDGKPAAIWVGTDYVYRDGKWADVVTESYSGIVMDMAELRPTSHVIYSTKTNGVERLPSEIIVKKKEKVGRRLMIS